MIRFSLKGMAGRKLRTALTALAVILGVMMVSGTFVLTDSIGKAFDAIFSSVYVGTDATITGKSAFDLSDGSGTTAPPFDESLQPQVSALPDVADAIGGVAGGGKAGGSNPDGSKAAGSVGTARSAGAVGAAGAARSSNE